MLKLSSKIFVGIISIILAILIIGSYLTYRYVNARAVTRWPEGAFKASDAGFEMAPSFSSHMVDSSFSVHSHKLGYRIPGFESNRMVKQGGILSVGCSFTYGDGIEAEETFTYQAAKMLGLPAYNYGVCAYSYANIILLLEELKERGILDELKPSMLMVGAGSWLVDRSLSPFFPTGVNGPPLMGPYIARKDGLIQIVDPPFSVFHIRSFAEKSNYDFKFRDFFLMFLYTPRILYAEFVKNRDRQPDVSSYELYNFVIDKIKEIIAPYKMKLVILWMPIEEDDPIDTELRKVLRKNKDIILVDGVRAVKKQGLPDEDYTCRHPDARAHMVYAQEIVRVLE